MSKWFEKLKRFSNNSAFVCGMVLLWMYLEYRIALLIKGEAMNPYLVVGIVVFAVLFVLKLVVVNHFKVSSLTIRKMMTNALGFKWLSLLFVLTFTMQLAWFVDAAYKLFVDGEGSMVNICQCGLTLSSLIVINLLFPIVDRKKAKISTDERRLLVTGFSCSRTTITDKNLELFLKPFKQYINIRKVIIVLSKTLLSCNFDNEKTNLRKDYNETRNTDLEKRKELFKKIIVDEIVDELKKKIIVDELKKEINVVFSNPVNYDDFDDIYNEVSGLLRDYEGNDISKTVVFITPGSATVTSALTPLAIKGQRALLFAEQSEPDMPIKESDIDVFTIEDLLNELWGEYEIDSYK